MKLSELLVGLEVLDVKGDTSKEITGICYDSRQIENDNIFVAIKGVKTDGHKYIKDAIKNGASTIIYQKQTIKGNWYKDIAFIKVNDSRKALAILSKNLYSNPASKMTLIGVTGTNGKTTITYVLKNILESIGKKVGIIGTTGIIIDSDLFTTTNTTPESLEIYQSLSEMLKEGVEIVILEVSSHSLIQSRVYGLDFDYAVFTNLTHDHLDYHKTMDNYAKAKKILFDNLKEDSIAIYNSDDKYGKYIVSDCKAKQIVSVGRNEDNDYMIRNERINLYYSEFDLVFNENRELNLKTQLAGKFNIDNVSFTSLVAKYFGIEEEIIAKTIEHSEGAPGRMQRVKLASGSIGIVDYAHTPDALEKVLSTCKNLLEEIGSGGKLISVFGCGGDRDNKKRAMMGKIASEIADKIILTDDNPRTEEPLAIIDDIYSGVRRRNRKKIYLIPDRADAISYGVNLSNSNDIVVVSGKGHEKYQIYGKKKKYFDDMEILQNYC